MRKTFYSLKVGPFLKDRTRTLLLLLLMLISNIGFAQLSYRFGTAVQPYAPLGSTATTHRTGGDVDDTPLNGIAIPFTFTFNGETFNEISFNNNGAVFFGATAPGTFFDFVISNPGRQFVMGAAADLTSGAAGTLKSEVLGTSPNRIFVAEYANYTRLSDEGSFNFQVRLHEDSNRVEIHYGNLTSPTGTVFVGLRGVSVEEYHTRTAAVSASAWSASNRGTTVTDQMPLTSVAFPAEGTKYIFTPLPRANSDLALVNVLGFPTGSLCDSSTLSFNVPVRNLGNTEQSPVVIAEILRGGNVISTVTYNGAALPSTNTQLACFSGLTVSGLGNYTLRVINVTADDLDENDTLTQNFTVNRNCGIGGYEVTQTNEPYVPIPLTESTNPLPGVFSGSGTVRLPFSFLYNGALFSDVTIMANGTVIPGTNALFNGILPLSNNRNSNIIAPFGDDLENLSNFDATDAYRVQYAIRGEAPNRKFVIQYTDLFVSNFSVAPIPDTSEFDFQVIIGEDHTISFHYGEMFSTNTVSRPVQVGLNLGNDSSFVHFDFESACNPSFDNLTDAENISNAAQYRRDLLPASGKLITFTGPPLATTDYQISGLIGVPTGFNNCDSSAILILARFLNISPNPVSGATLRAYLINDDTDDTVSTTTTTLTTEVSPLGIVDISFNEIRVSGEGVFRISVEYVGTDANLANNTFTSGAFGTRVCPQFPYVFSTGTEPYQPLEAASSTQIIATGTDDGESGIIDLPFSVLVGNILQSQYRVGSNGALVFGTGGFPASSFILNGTDNSIAALNYDAFINGTVRNATIGDAPNRTHIIEWAGSGSWNPSTDRGNNNFFQVRIAESGEITIHYGDMGPRTANNNVAVGFRLDASLYNVRTLRTADTSWTNPTSGVLGASMPFNQITGPRSGLFYRWTPPVRTGADYVVNGFLGAPGNDFCDSNTISFAALIGNVSTTTSTGITVRGEVINATTNAVVATQEFVITDEVAAFGVDTAFFTDLAIPGPGNYRVRATIVDIDGDTANNRRTGASFSAITCERFPYVFSQGVEEYIALDSSNARVLIAGPNDDGSFGPFTMPFPVLIGRRGFDSFSVGSNGALVFGNANQAGSGGFFNNNTLIAQGFDQYVNGGNSRVIYDTLGEFPNRTFVVQWTNTGAYSDPDRNANFNYQIRITEDGEITFHYGQYGAIVGTYGVNTGVYLSALQYDVRTFAAGSTSWDNTVTSIGTFPSLSLSSTVRPDSGFYFRYTLTPFLSPSGDPLNQELGISVVSATASVCPVNTVPLSVRVTSNTSFPIAKGTITGTVTSPSGSVSSFSQNFASLATNGGSFNISLGNIEVSEVGNYVVNYTLSAPNDENNANDVATFTVTGTAPDATPVITNLTGIASICGTNAVALQAPEGAVQYLWSNGATTREISVANRGSFTVQTRSANGCLSLPSEPIVIDSASIPTVNFTATADRLNVIVEGVAEGASGFGYFWNGGSSAGQLNDTITFPAAGTYEISFYGLGICGNDTVTQSIEVIEGIVPSNAAISILPGTRTFCQNSTTSFTARATNAGTSLARLTRVVYTVTSPSNVVTSDSTDITNVLTVGNGVSFGARDLNLTEVGNYTVTAIIRAENESDLTNNTVSEVFTVQGAIAAPVISGSATAVCAGSTVSISPAIITPGNSYLWSNGATTESITVSEAGSYSLRVVNGVCTSDISNAVEVVINPTPATPSITVTGNTTLCGTETATLAAPAGFASYIWSNGATTESIVASATDSYTVRVVTAAGCTSLASAGTVISVQPITPTPTISAGGPLTFCAGANVVLTAPIAASYLWSTGATTRTITVSDNQTIWLQTTEANSCISVRSAEVVTAQVALPAQPVITASRPATFCANDSTVLELPAGFAGYSWSNGATTRTITVRNAASFTGTVANETGCISPASAAIATTVNPLTVANFTFTVLPNQPKVVVTNTSTNGTSHVFRYTGGTSTRTTDTITFPAAGSYAITIISTNACGTDSLTRNVVLSNKVSGIAKYVSAYPNPANNFLNVDFGTLQFSEATITLLDVTGKVVMTTTANGNTRLDIAHLPAAVYNVRVAVAGEAPANFSVVKR